MQQNSVGSLADASSRSKRITVARISDELHGGASPMNIESRAQFLDFDDFEIGDMVKECPCDGIMSKQRVADISGNSRRD